MPWPSRARFLNLRLKRSMNALKPFPWIPNVRITPQIVSHLITDQTGVNHEQRGWQKSPACLVVATEKVFRQQEQCRTRCRTTAERDLLPDQTVAKEKHCDWQEHNNRR